MDRKAIRVKCCECGDVILAGTVVVVPLEGLTTGSVAFCDKCYEARVDIMPPQPLPVSSAQWALRGDKNIIESLSDVNCYLSTSQDYLRVRLAYLAKRFAEIRDALLRWEVRTDDGERQLLARLPEREGVNKLLNALGKGKYEICDRESTRMPEYVEISEVTIPLAPPTPGCAHSPDDGDLSKPPQGGSGVPERQVGCWLCGALGGGSDPVKCENPACLGKKPQSCVGPASEMPEGLDEGERELWRMTQRLSYLFTERPVKILLQTIAALRAEVESLKAKVEKYERVGLSLTREVFQLKEERATARAEVKRLKLWYEGSQGTAQAYARDFDGARKEVERLKAKLTEKEARIKELRRVANKREYRITQALGKALGYPWLKDDQKNFPSATEADGVCVGDHVAETLAEEAAAMLTKKDTALCGLLAEENNLTTALDAEHAEHCSNDKNRAEWKADMERTEQAFAAARAVVPSGPAPRSVLPEPTPPPGPGKPRYRSCPGTGEVLSG